MADPVLVARFMSKVRKSPTCWLWTASVGRGGYGAFSVGGRSGGIKKAHRVAYQLFVGEPGEHQVVGLFDAQAEEVLELCVKHVMTGRVSPDSDFRGRWEGVLDKTAEHYRSGKHGGVHA